eukprot:CAMPEP_0118933010 /NCGR_PEP_ID=MMETSP1169-20130426/10941_1 /TAXON_ID=36882 /ORGANISM="Pyramimonas obovata, Strain CCMP722" /LENGTH=309 /DNA_ID=CAMNT_0006875723 /DNA_START=101 /DNA_END=1027 /DNA_ORIENTATION=-
MALTIGEGGSISASVSAADDAPMRVTFGKPLKPEIQLNSDDLNWGHSKRNAAAGVSVLSLIPVVSLIFNKLKAMRRAHMEKKEKEKRVKRGMAKKIKRLQAELELASGIVLKVDDQRNEIELMQQEVRERKEYAAKLEEQLRSDVVQQEILRADLEDSVIEAVEEMKKANEEKLELQAKLEQMEKAYAAEVEALQAKIQQLTLKVDQGAESVESFEDAAEHSGLSTAPESPAQRNSLEAAEVVEAVKSDASEQPAQATADEATKEVAAAETRAEEGAPEVRSYDEELNLARSLIEQYLQNGGEMDDLAD